MSLPINYISTCTECGERFCKPTCSHYKAREVDQLRADLAAERARAEKAEADVRWMVERAANQSLDGYRELASKCAELEADRDRLRAAIEQAPCSCLWTREGSPCHESERTKGCWKRAALGAK